MSETQEKLIATLNRAAQRLREAGLPNELVSEIERLAGQVRQRCVVAVVGQVKAGKSTFVNALLGGDLAKVGTTETTATINYFSHGRPPDPDRPVRCHWQGGKSTHEDRTFLDNLQGNDLETLRRADGIERLEYFLEHPFLEQLTLVDTPGTNAAVDEHQDRTAEFIKLHHQLRERHNEDTQKLGREADAVIYLTGAVARATDQVFLEEFKKTTGGRSSALNALGVMSKIETQPEILVRRHELAGDIAQQLKDELNAVIPVGAGIRRELDRMSEDGRGGLEQLIITLRRIPSGRLESMIKKDTRFLEREYEDCPVNAAERRELVGGMPWSVFVTIARVVADPELSVEGVRERLEEISNFEVLKETLNRHFIDRGHILRAYRIVVDAREVLNELRYTYLPKRRKAVQQEKGRLERFLALIRQAGGDPGTTGELEDFVRRHLDADRQVAALEALHQELDKEFGELHNELVEHNADFEALQRLEGTDHRFSDAELDELRPLLGLYGSEVEKRLPPGKADSGFIIERMLHWKQKIDQAAPRSIRRTVAERAYTRYGIIYEELATYPTTTLKSVDENAELIP